MIDTLYANGCSFTAGSELEHEAGVEPLSPADADIFRRERSWPRILGDRIGVRTVVNEARGGGSNARAIRMTYDFAVSYLSKGGDPSRLLVTIGITNLSRNEIRTANGEWQLLKPSLAARSTKDRAVRRRNEIYYREFFDLGQAAQLHVQQYVGLGSFLSLKGIPYHFHEAMSNNASILRAKVPTESVLGLLAKGTWRGLIYEDTGVYLDAADSFERWAITAKVPLGLGGHPLAEGHRRWAEKLHEDVESLC